MRARIANGHSESFVSTISDPDIKTFLGVRDTTLAPGGEMSVQSSSGRRVVLPLVGAVQATVDGVSKEVRSEQVFAIPAGSSCLLTNLTDQPVTVALFSLNGTAGAAEPEVKQISLKSHDELVGVNLFDAKAACRMSVGVYRSRSETIYKCRDNSTEVLLFVVNGSFEVEGRLIEYRDSLVLWDKTEIELEALADDSIICILENSK